MGDPAKKKLMDNIVVIVGRWVEIGEGLWGQMVIEKNFKKNEKMT